MNQIRNKDESLEILRLEYCFDRGVNIKDRVIQITGEIEEGYFDFLDSALNEMERNTKKAITIRINSPGGSIYEALAMVGRLKKSKCQIITEGYGQIMSASTLLLAAGDKRRLSKYSFFMHHESSYDIEGRHSDVRDEIEHMERMEVIWSQWISELSHYDKEYWYNKGRKKNFYLTAQECLEHGVVDELF